MSNTGVKVLGTWPSPLTHRVEWALRLKGIDYEYIDEDVFNKSSLLLELNPVDKKVPVLIHDNKVIIESCLILQYIDETWKDKSPLLLPQDPYERSIARFWVDFEEREIFANVFKAHCTQGDQQETAIETYKQGFEKIEEVLKGKSNFFGGENIGYLDLVLAWMPHWMTVYEQVGKMEILNQAQFPALFSWIKKIGDQPVTKDKLPSQMELIDFYEEHKEDFGARFAAVKKN